MIKRLKPKKFTEEQLAVADKTLREQKTTTVAEKSLDPENFPVHDTPVNKKEFVYVPNLVDVDADGNETFRMDVAKLHSIQDGRRFQKIRCIAGSEMTKLGYSGTCPFCEVTSDCWDLANEIINDRCAQKGLDPANKDDDEVMAIRREAFNSRAVQNPTDYYTFPIVVIETDPNDIKKFVRDENGHTIYKIMWYSISENSYKEKWLTALESMEDEPSHPGGHCFVLNYTYTVPKNSQPNKRDSARNMKVIPKKMNGFEEAAKKFDELAAAWTPQKARETVVDNILAEEEDLREEALKIAQPIRDKIELYRRSIPAQETGGFKLSPTEDVQAIPEGIAVDTDID